MNVRAHLAALVVSCVLGGAGICVCAGEAPTSPSSLYPTVERTGSVALSVVCSEGTGGMRWASFGMPFPRGFLTDVRQVVVRSDSGDELPADVSELARWRHFASDALDGASIRSVLVTFAVECRSEAARRFVVAWGVPRRADAGSGVTPMNVALGWRVQAPPQPGEHRAVDNYSTDWEAPAVREPTVWVSLPREWLMKQNLRGPVAPMRDARFEAYLAGFMGTYVNDVAPDVTQADPHGAGKGFVTWATMVEGWLYDRPLNLWSMYVHTGDVRWQRRAHRASQFYAGWIVPDSWSSIPYRRGAFRKKASEYSLDRGDAKYSYAGGLVAAYLLTGDARLLETVRNVADFVDARVDTRLLPYGRTRGLWTERQVYVALSAALYAYEATGDPAYRRQVARIVDGMKGDLAKPPAGYPDARGMEGVLLHRPEVHEGDRLRESLIMSPWMSALLGDALWHYYAMSEDRFALMVLSSYADFVARRAIYNVPSDPHLGTAWGVWYTVGTVRGYTDDGIWADVEHAPDVLGLLARGRWARQRLGLPTTTIDQQMERLKQTTLLVMGQWVRDTPGLPRFRAAPLRKVAWWFGNGFDLGWFGVF